MKSARRTVLVSVDAEQEARTVGLRSTGQAEDADQAQGGGRLVPRELDAEALEDNVSEFFESVAGLLHKASETIGDFRIKEFTVSAEVTADGKISLIGVGGGVAAKGGLTFTFERVAGDRTT